MVVCVECLLADKPWDMVSATRRSSGVSPRACVRVYARVLVPPNLYIHTYIALHRLISKCTLVIFLDASRACLGLEAFFSSSLARAASALRVLRTSSSSALISLRLSNSAWKGRTI